MTTLERTPSGRPPVWLHGNIDIHIIEARNVEGIKGTQRIKKLSRAITSSMDGVDPYCSVKLGYNKVMQTSVVQNDPNPKWNQRSMFYLCHELDAVEFRIKAAKRTGPLSVVSKVQHLSMLALSATDVARDRVIDGWFPLTRYLVERVAENCADDTSSSSSEEDEPKEGGLFRRKKEVPLGGLGDIRIRVVYTPVGEAPSFKSISVPDCYFPARSGCRVSLYQDADCPPGSIPQIPFKPDHVPGRCWRDIAHAIVHSVDFVYLTGWAVWPELQMIRTDFPGDQDILPEPNMTLGELLKWKADQGVTVCVMVWDELASGNFAGFIKSEGLMGTHDEQVVDYFKKSKVHAIKVGRVNQSSGPLADLNDNLLFTHHQKTVIVTVPDSAGSGKSRVQAFVGGLDLTDGRYDNNSHSLFRTLRGVHAPPDFWQACALTVGSGSGPREPWQDIHAFTTGVAAWDVLANFEGRWKRQASTSAGFREAVGIRDIEGVLHNRPQERFVTPREEDERREGEWNVQVLRSITEASTILDQARPGLVCRRSALIDQSIAYGYYTQIRNSVSYVYLENQYFLGSSHLWDSGQRGGFASHLVPIEIAEKICAKIRANERFAVYVTVPMYPEGAPDSAAVQEILSHQRKTVTLITSRIAEAIRETGSNTSITDWFNLFCLVNRESVEADQGDGGTNPVEKKLSESRRFMVYVHSKLGCFDDTSVIVGSANLNSRSLDGGRDTEIAQLMWKPAEKATGSSGYAGDIGRPTELPKGDVAAFRCGLWAEHLGGYYPEFEDPSSLECVRKVRQMAIANWTHFAAEGVEAADMPYGHLALYPYAFDEDSGEITTLLEHFPDFPGALIKGKAGAIPNMLTG